MIMVIGGYGQVGGFASRQIDNVIVAGRNQSKADKFILDNNINGISRYIDTNNIKKENFDNVDTVIMGVESNNVGVLQACIKYKINYIDISPSFDILSEIIKCKTQINEAGIRCVIGVGIAPGISNLLCKEASKEMDQINTIDSYLMLGLGEEHGKNAILWFLQHIYSTTKGVDSFKETKNIILDRKHGKKKQKMARIDLADWHIMEQEYKDAICRSWFSYDVSLITGIVCFMKRLGIFKSLVHKNPTKREKAYRRFQKILHLELSVAKFLHIGTDEYAVQVQVSGIKDGKEIEKVMAINGNCNSQITAKVAVKVAEKIEKIPEGLHFLDQVMDLEEVS